VEEKKLSYTPQGKPSGQLFASYLVCLGPEGLVLVDQHAAHERITYERTLDLLKTEGTQRLLQPFHFDLDAAETELLDTLLPDLEELGIEIGRTGDRDFRITAMPFTISRQGAVACIRDILDKVRRGEAAPKVPDFRKHLASSVACHSSVRAHRKLAPEEASALLQDLFQAEDPAHCPHGRPTFITIGRYEIEKRFGRK
jgi:DNA mismatch repair protein MutL